MLDYLTSEEEPRWTRWLLLLFIPLGALYLIGARGNSETFNTSRDAMYSNDQKVYLRLAQDLKESGWTMVTPRHRTPGYPYVLSLFFTGDLAAAEGSKDPVSAAWFARARGVGIGLSVLLLGGLYFFFRRSLPRVEAGLLTAALACLLYVFRAGYTQPELLYWSLNTVLFYLLMRLLIAPTWALAATAGGLSALTFLVKAATQPLLLLFAVSFAIKLIWDHVREETSRADMLRRAGQGALVPALFFTLLSPYLINSTRIYGEPFYSVYSKYLMWVLPEPKEHGKRYIDKHKMWAIQNAGAGERPITLDEYRTELRALKDRYDQPYVEPDAFPSPGRYLERRRFDQIAERPAQGLRSTKKRMDKYYPAVWTFLKALFWAAGLLALWRWRWVWAGFKARGYVALYAAGFFVGYLLLYGWYDALRIGPRLMLSLLPPALFVLVLFIARAAQGLAFPIAGRRVLVGRVLNVAVLVLLVALSTRVFTDELYRHFSGG